MDNGNIDNYTRILAINNWVGGLLHIAFQFYLLNEQSPYRGFLLIENMLIAAVFIYFGYGLLFLIPKQRVRIIQQNIVFWFMFVVGFLLFQPKITSLMLLERYLPLQQKDALLIIGLITLAVCVLSYRATRRMIESRHAPKTIA